MSNWCPNVKLSFSTLLKGKMFSINKKGRNYQKGVPLSRDLRNHVKELAQDYCFAEVRRRLRISKGADQAAFWLRSSVVHKILNQWERKLPCFLQEVFGGLVYGERFSGASHKGNVSTTFPHCFRRRHGNPRESFPPPNCSPDHRR